MKPAEELTFRRVSKISFHIVYAVKNRMRKSCRKARLTHFYFDSYFISCSSWSNMGAVKKSLKEMSKPSQSFLMVVMEISRRLGSSILYTVEGVTPERFASSLIRIPRWIHSSRKRCATASLTIITFITRER